jgi:acetyltransferase-like isoleucine patch superfamily enzyme
MNMDDAAGWLIQRAWERACWLAAIRPGSPAARRFGRYGQGSIICFPTTTIYNEQYIHIGRDVRIGPQVSLSVGMAPGQVPLTNPVVTIGDRVMIGKGSAVVGHMSIEIGDDVFTGHHVYITDQNHGWEELDVPIGLQTQPERPVSIGAQSWLGHGVVVLPGARIGRHVAVAAGAVVTGDLPDYAIAAGVPARVIRLQTDAARGLKTLS